MLPPSAMSKIGQKYPKLVSVLVMVLSLLLMATGVQVTLSKKHADWGDYAVLLFFAVFAALIFVAGLRMFRESISRNRL